MTKIYQIPGQKKIKEHRVILLHRIQNYRLFSHSERRMRGVQKHPVILRERSDSLPRQRRGRVPSTLSRRSSSVGWEEGWPDEIGSGCVVIPDLRLSVVVKNVGGPVPLKSGGTFLEFTPMKIGAKKSMTNYS